MLTFTFTGVSGSMTEQERLTSGMVGKQVRIVLSEDWEGLDCTLVFTAGDLCRTVPLTGSTATIPEDILRYPFRKLLVGVYGTNNDNTLVIPTVLAEGPFVELGANPYADPVAVALPVWQTLQNQIGTLAQLTTGAKQDLVSAINEIAGNGQIIFDGSGGYFTPAVTEDGTLSWSNNMGLSNPQAVNLRGSDGCSIFPAQAQISEGLVSIISIKPSLVDSGGREVQVGDLLLTENGCLARVTASTAAAVQAEFLTKLVPVRGSDYWTEEDIAQIRGYVDEAILGGAW